MIVTHHNDNRRSGANLAEVTLKPGNVNANFGKLFELPVVGAIYAQPLVVPHLTIDGRVRAVLYVATMHNRVYAFDANVPHPPLWERDLGPSIQLPDPQIGPGGYKDIEWEVGIVSTPVIDTDKGAIYLIATSKQPGDNSIIHQLFMLDLTTGRDLKPSRVIGGTAGRATFVSHKQIQRSALLLSRNKVYAAFASYGDAGPYNGWVLSFDADSLTPLGTFCTTPQPAGDSGEGGIWMAGHGPSADEKGSLYLMTGNGDFDPHAENFGDCVVKLDPNLVLADFFSPSNNPDLDARDLDLGSGGILAIPGTNMIVGGGKEAFLYLMDMNHLGGFNTSTDNVLDKFPASSTDGNHHIHGTPVYWNGPDGPYIYVWTENDQCKAFRFLGTSFNHTPAAQSTVTAPENFPGGTPGMPGGILSISANGTHDGILWASHPWAENLNQKIGEGVLHAFDARSLQELWNSRNNQARDDFGNLAKFCPPAIANGKVYMATMGGLSHKVTLQEPALAGPAIVKRGDDSLVLGWSSADAPSGHLNLIASIDGVVWQDKVIIPNETTHNALSLAFDGGAAPNGRMFIAWTGDGGVLNVMSSGDAALQNWDNKFTLDEHSKHGPALLFANQRLYLAWIGTDGQLNVKSSQDLGASWQNENTPGENSPNEPALAFWNGNLILMWNGADSKLNFIQSADGGSTWGHKVTITDTSQQHPAMAIGADGVPYFCWAGSGPAENGRINLLHSENGETSGFLTSPNYKRTFSDPVANGPSLCEFRGKIFIAWTGTDPGNHVNVAQLSRGAVAVYGLPALSFRKRARSLQTNSASGIVEALGRRWPPPPRISVRSLLD